MQGLLNAPKLSSLDLRGCPVTSTDNYRRWVIARAPATLKMLDGKEVSALERRYAYNLFPECRPKDAVVPPAKPPAAVSLSQKAPLVAGEEDIFTLGELFPLLHLPLLILFYFLKM